MTDSAETVPAVDVAIVNWNTAAQAIEAARGYLASEGVQVRVTVIDNDSRPDQVDLLRRESGLGYRLIDASENLGFGTAANRALADGDGDFIVVSNADVLPDSRAVAALAEVAAGGSYGMVAPVFADTGQVYHDRLPRPLTLLARTIIGSFGRQVVATPGPGMTAEIEQPSGACFLMRRSDWDRAGGFDQGYFLWYEDVDLARRLLDEGKPGAIVGDASVNHIGGESFAMLSEGHKQRIRIDSLRRYISKHHRITSYLAKPLLWLSTQVRAR